MADEQAPTTPQSNGAASPTPEPAARPTLREVAEASWDQVQEAADAADAAAPADEQAGQDGRARDSLGRFAPADQVAKPGEAEQPLPAPTPTQPPSEAKPVDPALGSNQPPQHWPEQDRQTFLKLPKEGQDFLLRRHTEMERDYQGKAQASATAVQFTNALAPIFQDPTIAGSLQHANVSPYEAINQWAGFHRRAMDPNPQVRMQLLQELGQRMGLDPAATGQMSQSGTAKLSEDDLKDPTIRYFADTLGRTFSDVQALRGELDQIRRLETDRSQQAVMQVTRQQIDG